MGFLDSLPSHGATGHTRLLAASPAPMAYRYRDCLLLYLDSAVLILRPHSSLISPCFPGSSGKQSLLFTVFSSVFNIFLLCLSGFVPAWWPPEAAVLQILREVSWVVINPLLAEYPSQRASLQAHRRHTHVSSAELSIPPKTQKGTGWVWVYPQKG